MKAKKFILFGLMLILALTCVSAYSYDDGVDSNNDKIGIAPTPVDGTSDIYAVLDYDLGGSEPIYKWYLNDKLKSEFTSENIDFSELIDGDEWKVKVSYMEYVGGYVGYVEVELGSETIVVVTSESDDKNIAPGAIDIHFTVIEGDFIDVNMVQDSNILSYIKHLANSVKESYIIYTYDADGDVLKISYDSLLNVNGMWQTGNDDAGVYTVIATVTDGTDSTEATITITVEDNGIVDDENTAPRVTDIHFTVTEGEVVDVDMIQDSSFLRFQNHLLSTRVKQSDIVYTYDADGDMLRISYDSLLNVNGMWQTGNDDAGIYTVIASVTDGTDSTEATITITVEDNGIVDDENTAPVIDNVADVEVDEGEIVNVCLSATDADGDSLIYTYDGTPSGSFDENGCWTWNTNYNDAGEYDVDVCVSDGEFEDCTSFDVIVNDVCDDENDNGICDDEEYVKSNFEGGLLKVQSVTVLNAKDLSNGNDDEIKVYVEMQNDNSYDAENIKVTLIFENEDYIFNFQDLDRSEVASAVYIVEVYESLETGRYPLIVKINNEDINYETAFNLDIDSNEVSNKSSENLTFWDKVVSFFRNLF